MKSTAINLSIILILSPLSSSLAAEISYGCPREIRTEQTVPEKMIPKDWVAKRDFNYEPQFLENLSLYHGPPEEGARLKPDAPGRTSSEPNVWKFTKEKTTSIWLGCEYRGTKMLLAKELPKDIVTCRLLPKDKHSDTYPGVACK